MIHLKIINFNHMKAVMIIFNQANAERVEYMFDTLGIRGFTWFNDVKGRGSESGEPRMGTHTWPEMNSAALTIVKDDQVDTLLNAVEKLDNINQEVGVRAFVWSVEKTV